MMEFYSKYIDQNISFFDTKKGDNLGFFGGGGWVFGSQRCSRTRTTTRHGDYSSTSTPKITKCLANSTVESAANG